MMDGRVAAIRQTLDNNASAYPGHEYAVKYAPATTGRSARQPNQRLNSVPASYQKDPANRLEPCGSQADIEEGADIIMVKRDFPIWTSCVTCAMNMPCRWLSTMSPANTA